MGIPYKFVGKVRQEIADAYASGEPLKSIAARYGADKSSVYYIARRMGITKRTAGLSKTAQIIELSQSRPDLSGRQIAAIIGSHEDWVCSIRRLCGFRHRMLAAKAILIVKASRENPDLGCERIAQLVGVSIAYAKEVRRKHGIRAQNYNFASVSAASGVMHV